MHPIEVIMTCVFINQMLEQESQPELSAEFNVHCGHFTNQDKNE